MLQCLCERIDIMKNEIIRILQHNARISNAALGEMLGIAPEEAAAEIDKTRRRRRYPRLQRYS